MWGMGVWGAFGCVLSFRGLLCGSSVGLLEDGVMGHPLGLCPYFRAGPVPDPGC